MSSDDNDSNGRPDDEEDEDEEQEDETEDESEDIGLIVSQSDEEGSV